MQVVLSSGSEGNIIRRRDLYTELIRACARRRRMDDCIWLMNDAESRDLHMIPKLLQVRQHT